MSKLGMQRLEVLFAPLQYALITNPDDGMRSIVELVRTGGARVIRPLEFVGLRRQHSSGSVDQRVASATQSTSGTSVTERVGSDLRCPCSPVLRRTFGDPDNQPVLRRVLVSSAAGAIPAAACGGRAWGRVTASRRGRRWQRGARRGPPSAPPSPGPRRRQASASP